MAGHRARLHQPGLNPRTAAGSFRDRAKGADAAAAAAQVDINAQIAVRQSSESQSHTAGFEVGGRAAGCLRHGRLHFVQPGLQRAAVVPPDRVP
jgi:hypothetical protein